MKVFNSWIEERNKLGAEKCPSDVLENPDVAVLDKWLSAFVVEVRREDGQQYPPNPINQLLAGLSNSVTIFIDSCIFLLQNNYFLVDHAHYLILYALAKILPGI